MSEGSDNDSDVSLTNSNILIETEYDQIPLTTIKTNLKEEEEEEEFIYNEELSKLICIGINFNDIPLNILHDYSLKTKILDLSGNNFRSLSCLENFPNLEELIIDDNELNDTDTIFPKLTNLHTLMINKNHFRDIHKLIDQLRQAYPLLTHLSLLGNEACPYQIISIDSSLSNDVSIQHSHDEEYRRYRHLLIFRIPTLKFLDAREIDANERRMATQLGDILYSIAETKKHTTMI